MSPAAEVRDHVAVPPALGRARLFPRARIRVLDRATESLALGVGDAEQLLAIDAHVSVSSFPGSRRWVPGVPGADCTVRPVRVLVAPDKFRGTLTARQAAEAFAIGWRRERPRRRARAGADGRRRRGHDGCAGRVARRSCRRSEGRWTSRRPGRCRVRAGRVARRNPRRGRDGEGVRARAASIRGGAIRCAPPRAGPGELMAGRDRRGRRAPGGVHRRQRDERRRRGHGVGARSALARRVGAPDRRRRRSLSPASTASTSRRCIRALARTQIVGACDVDNPLTGPSGASAVFGPQKGASPDDVAVLDRALGHLAAVVERDLGVGSA